MRLVWVLFCISSLQISLQLKDSKKPPDDSNTYFSGKINESKSRVVRSAPSPTGTDGPQSPPQGNPTQNPVPVNSAQPTYTVAPQPQTQKAPLSGYLARAPGAGQGAGAGATAHGAGYGAGMGAGAPLSSLPEVSALLSSIFGGLKNYYEVQAGSIVSEVLGAVKVNQTNGTVQGKDIDSATVHHDAINPENEVHMYDYEGGDLEYGSSFEDGGKYDTWGMINDPDGNVFFVNWNRFQVSWQNPKENPDAKVVPLDANLLGPLPPDWERAITKDGRVFFSRIGTRETAWEDPRITGYKEMIKNDRFKRRQMIMGRKRLRKTKREEPKEDLLEVVETTERSTRRGSVRRPPIKKSYRKKGPRMYNSRRSTFSPELYRDYFNQDDYLEDNGLAESDVDGIGSGGLFGIYKVYKGQEQVGWSLDKIAPVGSYSQWDSPSYPGQIVGMELPPGANVGQVPFPRPAEEQAAASSDWQNDSTNEKSAHEENEEKAADEQTENQQTVYHRKNKPSKHQSKFTLFG